jgi:predicted nucleic acid-binding protein
MVTYVLDSSAVLRFLDDEAGANRVAEVIKGHLAGTCLASMSAIHWGEIAGVTAKVHGEKAMDLVLSRLYAFGLEIILADEQTATRAALIKLKKAIPFVDCFAVEIAASKQNAVLLTADFDFKAVARDVRVEFLPAK